MPTQLNTLITLQIHLFARIGGFGDAGENES